MRRGFLGLLAGALLCACALACAPMAVAAPADGAAGEIGSLSSRYGMLDDLANSRNSEENVVVETHVTVLTGANRALDGSSVRFVGEAVGEPVRAGDGLSWVSVNDESGQGIAVLCTDAQLQAIDMYGSYRAKGTTLQVTGVYHVACTDHQGELDVHASEVEAIGAGTVREHAVGKPTLVAAGAFIVVGGVLVACYLLVSRRVNRRET